MDSIFQMAVTGWGGGEGSGYQKFYWGNLKSDFDDSNLFKAENNFLWILNINENQN